MAPMGEPDLEGYLMRRFFGTPQNAYTFEELINHIKKSGDYIPHYELSAALTALIRKGWLIIQTKQHFFGSTKEIWVIRFIRP